MGSPHILLEEIQVVPVFWESNLAASIKLDYINPLGPASCSVHLTDCKETHVDGHRGLPPSCLQQESPDDEENPRKKGNGLRCSHITGYYKTIKRNEREHSELPDAEKSMYVKPVSHICIWACAYIFISMHVYQHTQLDSYVSMGILPKDVHEVSRGCGEES